MKRNRRIYFFTRAKVFVFSIAVFIAIILIGATAATTISVISRYITLQTRNVVVLDAGHGGVDGGAIYGPDIKEKDITLDVVLLTRYYLVQRGIHVKLTRDTDRDVSGWDKYQKGRHRRDLKERARILDGGSIGVSIHVNTTSSPAERGALVFYAKGSEEGRKLATLILSELESVQILNYSDPIPRTNLYLLTATHIPVILIELGFLSNPEDREKLLNADMRDEMARAIAEGILNYFGEDNQELF